MKIFCVGRNYEEHIKELGNESPEFPVIFMKPETAILKDNAPFYYPDFSKEIQYEVEMVIKIDREGKNIQPKFAHKYFNEIGIGIDFTARDLQNKLKAKGLPWEISKGFNGSAPISSFISKQNFENVGNINFSLFQNEILKQKGNTQYMIHSFDNVIAYISTFFMLKKGDLIFSGTPAGVGEVKIGDKLTAFIENQLMLSCEIA
jgi:acylpyruvate hydrolase